MAEQLLTYAVANQLNVSTTHAAKAGSPLRSRGSSKYLIDQVRSISLVQRSDFK